MQNEPLPGHAYRIGLCCGDTRIWEFVGVDARGGEWWRDPESGDEFSADSLMYAWWIIEAYLPAPDRVPEARPEPQPAHSARGSETVTVVLSSASETSSATAPPCASASSRAE